MDYILSKIISRPARSVNDHCDITPIDTIVTPSESFDTHLTDNGFCDNAQLSTDIEMVKWTQLIVSFASMAIISIEIIDCNSMLSDCAIRENWFNQIQLKSIVSLTEKSNRERTHSCSIRILAHKTSYRSSFNWMVLFVFSRYEGLFGSRVRSVNADRPICY